MNKFDMLELLSLYSCVLSDTYVKLSIILLTITITAVIFRKTVLNLLERALLLSHRKVSLYNNRSTTNHLNAMTLKLVTTDNDERFKEYFPVYILMKNLKQFFH